MPPISHRDPTAGSSHRPDRSRPSPRRRAAGPGLLLILALLAGMAGGAARAQAQLTGVEPAVAAVPAGARTAALGGAVHIGSPDADAVFLHPALVALDLGRDAAGGAQLGYARIGDDATALSAAAVVPWFGGGLGISVHTLEYDAAASGLLGGLVDPPLPGTGGLSEAQASLTWGRMVGPVSVGLTGRLLGQRGDGSRRTLEGVDVGLAGRAGPLVVAVSGRNLGGAAGLPGEVVFGAATRTAQVGWLDVSATAQARVREGSAWRVSPGLELSYWPVQGRTFFLRGGAELVGADARGARDWGVGGGFRGDEIRIDYAWVPVDDGTGIHRISVGWRQP